MAERKAFSFLRSFYESACAIESKEEQADFYNAIFRYVFDGKESEINGTPLAMFLLAKPNIDTALRKSEAGALGGTATQERNKNNDKQDKSTPQAEVKQTSSTFQADLKQDKSTPQAEVKQTSSTFQADLKQDKSTPQAINDKGDMIKDIKNTVRQIDVDFDAFWSEYPKKVGKGAAKKAFEKARKKATLESLVTAVRRQKCGSQWTREDGRFIPNPATWLNQERWEDEVDGGNHGSSTGYSEDPGLQRLSEWEQQHTF